MVWAPVGRRGTGLLAAAGVPRAWTRRRSLRSPASGQRRVDYMANTFYNSGAAGSGRILDAVAIDVVEADTGHRCEDGEWRREPTPTSTTVQEDEAPTSEDDDGLEELNRCLVDTVYGLCRS